MNLFSIISATFMLLGCASALLVLEELARTPVLAAALKNLANADPVVAQRLERIVELRNRAKKLASEVADREKLAREVAAREKLAREVAARDKAEKLAREVAEREKLARKVAARNKAEQLGEEKLARLARLEARYKELKEQESTLKELRLELDQEQEKERRDQISAARALARAVAKKRNRLKRAGANPATVNRAVEELTFNPKLAIMRDQVAGKRAEKQALLNRILNDEYSRNPTPDKLEKLNFLSALANL